MRDRAFDPVTAHIDNWPSEITFVPWVGNAYHEGIEGTKVLILGESHYDSKSEYLARPHSEIRNYTKDVFCDGVDDPHHDRSQWDRFSKTLDKIATRNPDPDERDSANAWKRIAYANHVQNFVGTKAGDRPDKTGWKSARSAFPLLMECLKPDVVLVLGSTNWGHTPSTGIPVGSLKAAYRNRDVWRMENNQSSFLMTWVYHPSSRYRRDTNAAMISIFGELLGMAKSG